MGYASFFEDIERERAANRPRAGIDLDAQALRVGGRPVREWLPLLRTLDRIQKILEEAEDVTDRATLNRTRDELLEQTAQLDAPGSYKVQGLDWVDRMIAALEPLVRVHSTSAEQSVILLKAINDRRNALRRLWASYERAYRVAEASPARRQVADLARLDLTEQQVRALSGAGVRRVLGGAGTGKTLVLLHRAIDLALRLPDELAFVVAPTHALAVALERLATMIVPKTLPNLRFVAMYRLAYEVVLHLKPAAVTKVEFAHSTRFRSDRAGSDEEWRDFKYSRGWRDMPAHEATAIFQRREFTALLDDATEGEASPDAFLRQELTFIRSLRPSGNLFRAYMNCQRTGRGRGMQRDQRLLCWRVLEEWESYLRGGGLIEPESLVQLAASLLEEDGAASRLPSELRPRHVLADEYQDLSTADLYVLWRMWRVRKDPGSFFLTGDLLQGTRVRHIKYRDVDESLSFGGRSHRLHLVLRCTEEIRVTCRAMLAPHRVALEESGNWDDDLSHVFEESDSPFHGSMPELHVFALAENQAQYLLDQVSAAHRNGRRVGVGCPTSPGRDALIGFLRAAGVHVEALRRDNELALQPDAAAPLGGCAVGTFADLKGQEFDEVVLFDTLGDEAAALDAEGWWRHLLLLYVAMTRARERLTITCMRSPPRLLGNVLIPIFHDLGSAP